MEKNTKILLGIGAAIALFIILKPKKAAAQENAGDPLVPDNPIGGGGVGIVQNPEPPLKPIDTGKKTAVEPTTKPCEVIYHNCTPNPRIEIIQIPYDDEKCDRLIRYGGYQPERPPCAPPMGGDDFMIIERFQPMQF